jgi:hypothetical protein
LRARLGAPKAIVAMAHHLASLVYRMLRYGENYVEKGFEHYEEKFRLQRLQTDSTNGVKRLIEAAIRSRHEGALSDILLNIA